MTLPRAGRAIPWKRAPRGSVGNLVGVTAPGTLTEIDFPLDDLQSPLPVGGADALNGKVVPADFLSLGVPIEAPARQLDLGAPALVFHPALLSPRGFGCVARLGFATTAASAHQRDEPLQRIFPIPFPGAEAMRADDDLAVLRRARPRDFEQAFAHVVGTATCEPRASNRS